MFIPLAEGNMLNRINQVPTTMPFLTNTMLTLKKKAETKLHVTTSYIISPNFCIYLARTLKDPPSNTVLSIGDE